jgi:cytochrome bd-type quinol oxidase subunit 1
MPPGRLGCIAAFIRNKPGWLTTRRGARPWRVFATMRGAAIMAEVAKGRLLRLVAGEGV